MPAKKLALFFTPAYNKSMEKIKTIVNNFTEPSVDDDFEFAPIGDVSGLMAEIDAKEKVRLAKFKAEHDAARLKQAHDIINGTEPKADDMIIG